MKSKARRSHSPVAADGAHVEIVQKSLAAIDRAAIEALDYPDDGPGGATKYLDVERWIGINAKRVAALELRPGSRVLDIGTGCGYLPFVLRQCGHVAIATDCTARDGVFRDVTRILGVEVMDLDVAPLVPLPNLGAFDVITAYMVTFNGHRVHPWGVIEWRAFLGSCFQMAPRVVLELNREPDTDSCYTPDLEAFFLGLGAEITGHWPHAPEPGGHRVSLIDRSRP